MIKILISLRKLDLLIIDSFLRILYSKSLTSGVWAEWKVQGVENIFLELCKATKHFVPKVYLIGG